MIVVYIIFVPHKRRKGLSGPRTHLHSLCWRTLYHKTVTMKNHIWKSHFLYIHSSLRRYVYIYIYIYDYICRYLFHVSHYVFREHRNSFRQESCSRLAQCSRSSVTRCSLKMGIADSPRADVKIFWG